jgi:hypothetical protein
MTPVYQEFHESIVGDCFRAAVASLLDMPLNMVPHFGLFEQHNFSALSLWLDAQDMFMKEYFIPDFKKLSKTKHYIGLYTLKDDDVESHAVIIKNKKVVHDPNVNTVKLKKLFCVLEIGNKNIK